MEVTPTPVADAPPPAADPIAPAGTAAVDAVARAMRAQTDAAAGAGKQTCTPPGADRRVSEDDLSPLLLPLPLPSPASGTVPGDLSSLSTPAAPSDVPLPITVYLTGLSPASAGGAAYIWDASDAMRLRKDFRLLGDPVGTMPKHTAQSQYLSLPLALSYTEAYFGVMRGFLRVVRDLPKDYPVPTAGDTRVFEEERERGAERHAEEVLEGQERMRVNRERKDREREKREQERNAKQERKRPREGEEKEERPTKVRRTGLVGRAWGAVAGMIGAVAARMPGWAWFRARAGDGRELPPAAANGAAANGDAMHIANGAPASTNAAGANGATHGTTANGTAKADANGTANGTSNPEALADRRRTQALASYLIETPTPSPAATRGAAIPAELVPPKGVSSAVLKRNLFVFEDLYDRGYCMSCGAKFGADFLAYASDPLLFHAPLAVVVDDGADLSGVDLVAQGRLGDSTKKRMVTAFVQGEGAERRVRYVGVQWEETMP